MAKQPTATVAKKMVIDLTGRKGLIDKYYGDINRFGLAGDISQGQPTYRYGAKEGQMANGIYNPIRKYGYLYPSVGTMYSIANNPTDVSFIGATVYDSINQKIYMNTNITGTANPPPLLRFDGPDSETPNTDRTVVGAVSGGDIEIYQLNGVRSLFYSYKTGTEWRIGVKDLTANTFVDNWLGTGGSVSGTFAPTINGEVKMLSSGDGYMYILNANELHRVDGSTIGGANGTITRGVLTAPTYFRLSHAVELGSNMYIAIQKTTTYEIHNATIKEGDNFVSECGVYVWNRQNAFNSSNFIPINGIREIRALYIGPKNDVRCITVSANGTTQIRIYNGKSFEVVKELGACAYPNYQDSLAVIGGFTVWLGYDGILYYHGAEIPGEDEFLFMMTSVGSGGLQSVLAGTILYASSTGYTTNSGNEKTHVEAFHLNYYDVANTTTRLVKFFPHAAGTLTGGVSTPIAAHVGNIYTPNYILPRLSTVKGITIFMARENISGTTADATIQFYKNGNPVSFMQKSVTYDDIAKGYKYIELNTPYVDLLQMQIQYSISSISNTRFAPAFAILEYNETATVR